MLGFFHYILARRFRALVQVTFTLETRFTWLWLAYYVSISFVFTSRSRARLRRGQETCSRTSSCRIFAAGLNNAHLQKCVSTCLARCANFTVFWRIYVRGWMAFFKHWRCLNSITNILLEVQRHVLNTTLCRELL